MTFKESLRRSILAILSEFLRVMKNGQQIDRALLARTIDDMRRAFTAEQTRVLSRNFQAIEGINTTALNRILAEKRRLVNATIDRYSFLVNKSATTRLTIGRRGQDIIRELSLNSLNEGLINGSPQVLGKELIVKQIKAAKLENSEEVIKEIRKAKNIAAKLRKLEQSGQLSSQQAKLLRSELRKSRAFIKEIGDKVPVFDGKDGRAKFMLEIKPYNGTYKAFDIENYADLVAKTTQTEAINEGAAAKAERLKTRLVKWNRTGKDYGKTKDHVCEKIDGKAYSILVEGVTIAGKFFEYWKKPLPDPFSTAHPNCNHRTRPVSEKLAARLTPGAA